MCTSGMLGKPGGSGGLVEGRPTEAGSSPKRAGNRYVIMEKCVDGTLAIRFGQRYLDYQDLGAPPPNPRSLSHRQHPAAPEEGRAPDEARPPAVTLAGGCSGRTPAEPYPSAGTNHSRSQALYNPAVARTGMLR